MRYEGLHVEIAAELAVQGGPQTGEGCSLQMLHRACSDSYFSIMTSRSSPLVQRLELNARFVVDPR
jgi:hypothetical protein